MNKKKVLIVMGILAVIYIVFMIFIGKNISGDNPSTPENNEQQSEKKDYKYLVVGDYSLWVLSKEGWKKLEKDEISTDLLKVYINNNYYGNYRLKYINAWNLYNNNDEYVSYEGNIVAFSNTLNVVPRQFEIQDITDVEINEINLLINTRITMNDISNSELIYVDLDNNGIVDKIVNVSNLKAEEIQEQYFNLCYVMLNNEQKVLIKELVDAEDIHITPMYNVVNIMNINNELKDSIVLRKRYFSNSGETDNIMFQYGNNNYIKVL